jgi:hypothetical protein
MKRNRLRISLAVLAVLALAIVLAPTLLSGVVGGKIVDAIAPKVEGSVTLGRASFGWLGPQRLEALAIDGGGEVGSIRVDVEVAQGLLALVTGDEVEVAIDGAVTTTVDAQGQLGLTRLARAQPAAATAPSAPAPASNASPLGGRRVTVRFDGLDLSATRTAPGAESQRLSIDDLRGTVALSDAASGGIAIASTLAADTKVDSRAGKLEISCDATVPMRAGAPAPLATVGRARVKASNLALPAAGIGAVVVDALALSADLDADGATLELDATASAAGAEPAKIAARIETAALADANGAFRIDPTAVKANVEVDALPLAMLAPYAPEIRPGVRLDLVRDLGATADLRLSHQPGARTRLELMSERVVLSAEADVAADGSGFTGGALEFRGAAQPALLAALGVDATGPLALSALGRELAWSRGGEPLAAAAGSVEVALAEPFEGKAPGDIAVRANSLRATFEKAAGSPAAAATVTLAANYGAVGAIGLSARASVDLSAGSIPTGALDANLAIDPATLERFTNGAVIARRELATLKISVPALSYAPADGVAAKGRVELGGALALDAGENEAMLSAFGADFDLPRAGSATPGSIEAGAVIDGAQARISQRFRALPTGLDGLAKSALEGAVTIEGIDPALIARLAPASADAMGLLGRGAMRVEVRNRVDGDALAATVAVEAPSASVSASLRARSDEILATDFVARATLTAESVKSLRLPETVELAPGARVVARVPSFRLARGAEGFAPGGEVDAQVDIEALVVRRAPGLSAALPSTTLATAARWNFADSRATARGTLTMADAAGAIDFDLAWRKASEATVFAGVEGTVAARGLDLAKLEGAFGAERGAWSGLAGGPGSLRVAISEKVRAEAEIELDFPSADATVNAVVEAVPSGSVARLDARVDASLTPERFATLAGLAGDPRRRVLEPVRVALATKSATVPLGAGFAPDLARATIDATATVSAVSIEITDAAGARTTVSTGALDASVRSAALADEIAIVVATAKPAPAGAGALDVDARVRNAIARGADAKAAPVLDATVRATRYPAAAIDALAGTKGAIRKYLGDAVDATIDARAVDAASGQGTIAARIASEFASLDAPDLALADGFLRVKAATPVVATLAMSPAVKQELLATINPVFADVETAQAARFTLSELSWPIDGDRSRFDAKARLEVGEVRLTNSGPLGFLIGMLGGERTTGFEALVEPLALDVAKGRLVYRDFALRAGKTASGQWKNSLVFAGDIDLAPASPVARAISTAVPLADAARWSSDARRVFEEIERAAPDVAKALTVGVELSGPLFDAQGRPAKLKEKLKLPDLGDVLRDNPGALIDAAGGIFDALRRKKDGAKPR